MFKNCNDITIGYYISFILKYNFDPTGSVELVRFTLLIV